jgi:hypothetical protein
VSSESAISAWAELTPKAPRAISWTLDQACTAYSALYPTDPNRYARRQTSQCCWSQDRATRHVEVRIACRCLDGADVAADVPVHIAAQITYPIAAADIEQTQLDRAFA